MRYGGARRRRRKRRRLEGAMWPQRRPVGGGGGHVRGGRVGDFKLECGSLDTLFDQEGRKE
jgi:hypothetical protein